MVAARSFLALSFVTQMSAEINNAIGDNINKYKSTAAAVFQAISKIRLTNGPVPPGRRPPRRRGPRRRQPGPRSELQPHCSTSSQVYDNDSNDDHEVEDSE